MADVDAYRRMMAAQMAQRNVLYDQGDPATYRTQMTNALMAPAVTPESRDGKSNALYGAMSNPAERPSDWAVSSGLAETLSPIGQGYGAGQMASYAKDAAQSGDYGTATGAGLMAAMSMMPMKKGLSMDHASRMARAQEMGFDTRKTWYHGTPNGILETIEPGRRDPGAWFTTDISNANNYARGEDANIHYTHLKTKNPFVVDHGGDGDFLPTHKGQPLDFTNNVDIVKYAQQKGYDSVHFPDGNFSESGNTMVVFDPTQVRETSAAFDPSNANSRNLLASGAGVGLLGYGSSRNEK